ncbi:V-type ATP synthase subunit E [Deinococcus psychrotolerans]|uniref:V-type proton ATPase subunit E n=2 Tax=Deinococcus TaxID=1298 RepID=A0A553V6H2_9DEIO|nr:MULTISPECIES: V-type ATP synthase subunit E [Deinococcus]AZI42695.1 V-type ATP synthase subunit E [Deinococcus psychrotolerans]TSA88075.1 V-type ATP synthase subunit E [Deinococcus detaillensis]
MALDKLLENEAQSEIERIRAEARDRAGAIIRAAQEQAQTLIESRTRALETQTQASLTRARSAADLERSASRLNAGENGMSRAFKTAQHELLAVTRAPEYKDILARLIAEARAVVPNAEAIEVHPNEAHVARELVTDLEVRENYAIQGGVRVVANNGKSGVTNTLQGRLERLQGTLAPQVSRILSEG